MKRSLLYVFSLLLSLLLVATAVAQLETGSLSGVVKDSSGAVVPNAQITVTSVGTGAVRTGTSDNSGVYTVSNLQPGLYEFKVTSSGFGDFKQRVNVDPGVRGTLDASLAAKGGETVVEVVGSSTTTVDTQTSTISEVVDQNRVANLPTLTRDPYDFIQTMGNVNQDSASGTGGSDQIVRGAGVSINGQRSASTDALLDGAENVDLFTTKVGQSVPLDSVQEFSVASSNFSAEYGRASGGVINVVTKSGTNNFHGSLYEFNRVSALTTNDVEDIALGNPKQKYTRNQFGYSVGGPVIKNKLFFFSTIEWTRIRSNATITEAVPDPALISASSALTQSIFKPFSFVSGLKVNQVVSAVTDPALSGAAAGDANLAAYQTAHGLGAPLMDIVSYAVPSDSGGGQPQNTYNMVQRVDFNLSDKTTMYGRYALFNQNEFAGVVNSSPYAGFNTGQTQHNQNFLYSLTHVFSPSVVNDLKINFNRLNNLQPLASTQPVQPSLYFNVNFAATEEGQLVCLPGYACTTPGNAIPFGGPQNVGQIADSVSWNKGNHSFRFGGQYVYTQDNRMFGAYENAVEGLGPFGGGSNADALDNLISGNSGWFQVVVNPQGKFPCFKTPNVPVAYIPTPACTINLPATQPSFSRSNRYNDMAFYGQDTWKVSPRLTLNLGLRWEYYGVQHNVDPALDSNFVYGGGATLQDKIRAGSVQTANTSPVGGLWNKNYHNFGPRVGFAYDLFGDGKTSLRGGYGIAYERNFGNVTFNVIQNPPAQFNSIFQVAAQPLATNNLGPFSGTGTKLLPNPSLRAVLQNIPTAYSQSWNLSLQRQVLRNSLVALEYTGAHSVHDYSIENYNQQAWGVLYEGADIAAGANPVQRLNLQYGNINARGFDGFSYYDALNTRFVSSNLFHQGLDITANYTYSHSIDNLSSTFSETPQTENLGLLDPFQPGLDKGSADFDARHRIALSAVWALPYAKNTKGVVRQILDGWEFSPIFIAHTGNPFTVFDSSSADFGIVDTVFARYFLPPGGVSYTGTTSSSTFTGTPNTFSYINLPPSATVVNPLLLSQAGLLDSELPSCGTTTNSLGDVVSTGKNCVWPSNMTGRNSFTGPGIYNINAAIGKTFPITEAVKLQFRGEFYNLLNHSNYYVEPGGRNDAGNYPCSSNPLIGCTNTNQAGQPGLNVFGQRGVVPAGGVPNERRFIQFAAKILF